jgi:hypothetical protein
MMFRAVLDTNVIVSAFLSRHGIPNAILRQAGIAYQLCLSQEILDETARVLREPRIQRRGGLSEAETVEFLESLRQSAVMISDLPTLDVVADDPDDNVVVACAVAAEADYLVSGDDHLRSLQQYAGIDIVLPAAFHAVLETHSFS